MIIIIENNRIVLPFEMKDHLAHILEYELWDEFVEYLKFKMHEKSISEIYDTEAKDATNTYSKKTVQNRTTYHKEFNEGKNKIIKHNRLFPDRIYTKLEEIGLPTIDETKVLSFWLSCYCYEFFFVQMPRFELTNSINENIIPDFQKAPPVYNINEIYESFLKLKKFFSLLYLPFTFGIIDNDFGDENLNQLEITKASGSEWLRQIMSEGFNPATRSLFWLDSLPVEEKKHLLHPKYGKFELELYDRYPILNTLFVILFSDLAEKILNEGDYDFRINTHKNFERDNSLLHFLLIDYMPKVIDLIKQYLSNTNSGLGAMLYLQFSKYYKDAQYKNTVLSMDLIRYSLQRETSSMYPEQKLVNNLIKNGDSFSEPIYPPTIVSNFTKYEQDYINLSGYWFSWFSSKKHNAHKYLEWSKNRNNSKYFNILNNAKTADELLHHTFDDRRKNRF